MSGGPAIIYINDSSNRLITGLIEYDRPNGGLLLPPQGTVFPGTPSTGEIFWRSDLEQLFRWDGATWQPLAAGNVITDHGALSGLGDDDHPQYQLRSEQGVANGYPSLDANLIVEQAVNLIRESSGPTDLTVGAIADGQLIQRVGSGIVGVTLDLLEVTNTPPVDVTKSAAQVGVSVEAARADHKHDVQTAAPVSIGTVNSEGNATSLARSNHVHAHGDLIGGSLHAEATTGIAGFLSAADKLKLDGIEAGAQADQNSAEVPLSAAIAELTAGITDVQAALVDLANRPYLVGFAQDLPITTILGTTFTSKVQLGPLTLAAGTYRLVWNYGWNADFTNQDFEAQLLQNGTIVGELHKQEPKDSGGSDPTGTTQRHYTQRVQYVTLAAGSFTWDLQFRADNGNNNETSMWEATIELWRVP